MHTFGTSSPKNDTRVLHSVRVLLATVVYIPNVKQKEHLRGTQLRGNPTKFDLTLPKLWFWKQKEIHLLTTQGRGNPPLKFDLTLPKLRFGRSSRARGRAGCVKRFIGGVKNAGEPRVLVSVILDNTSRAIEIDEDGGGAMMVP